MKSLVILAAVIGLSPLVLANDQVYKCTREESGLGITYLTTVTLKSDKIAELDIKAVIENTSYDMCKSQGSMKVTGARPEITLTGNMICEGEAEVTPVEFQFNTNTLIFGPFSESCVLEKEDGILF